MVHHRSPAGQGRFSELLNLRFGPPIRSNPLGQLMACQRIGSVSEYQDRFEVLHKNGK